MVAINRFSCVGVFDQINLRQRALKLWIETNPFHGYAVNVGYGLGFVCIFHSFVKLVDALTTAVQSCSSDASIDGHLYKVQFSLRKVRPAAVVFQVIIIYFCLVSLSECFLFRSGRCFGERR